MIPVRDGASLGGLPMVEQEESLETMLTHRKLMTVCCAAVLTLGLAACGGGGGSSEAPAPPGPSQAVLDARAAAVVAAMAANTAADAAEEAARAQADNSAADEASYAVAQNAATRARAAAAAAHAASTAAAEATSASAAEAQQAIAEAKQAEAETEQGNAEMYAQMVADAHQAVVDENERQMDVADARTRAQASYEAAEADAAKADMQASEAEAAAPGSPGAIAARMAATNAQTAAVAARAAHDAIMDDMTKAEADAEATKAATAEAHANSGYMTAMAENDDIQTNASTIAENQRQRDVADARNYGGMSVDRAKAAADDARAAAVAAKTAADEAQAEYERAMSARTNAPKAEEQADAAQQAYMDADAAADLAQAAYEAAKAAIDGVMDDSSSDDANTARSTAATEEGNAAAQKTAALMSQTDAEGALDMATTYADYHVVGLLRMANAYHITTAADPNANTDETEADLIATNKANHVTAVNTAVEMAAGDSAAPSHGGGELSDVSWPHSATVANTDADEDTERTGKPLLTITPEGGTALALTHAGPGADGNAGTADDVADNFGQGPGLGDFVHEKYISSGDATPRTRVILFTDLTQATEPKDARTDTVDNEAVSTHTRVGITNNIVEATPTVPRNFPGTYDHDGDPDTPVFTGTFTCADPLTCRVSRTGTANDGMHVEGETEVTDIFNYRFTGTRTIAEMNPVEDTTWLAFGVWLTEAVVEEGTSTNTYTFGAFADGGTPTEGSAAETVTGTATY